MKFKPKEFRADEYMKYGLLYWLVICVVWELLARAMTIFNNGTILGAFTIQVCGDPESILTDSVQVVPEALDSIAVACSGGFHIFYVVLQCGAGMLMGLIAYTILKIKKNS